MMRNWLRSEAPAVPAAVTVTAEKSMVSDGVNRKPKTTTLVSPAKMFPASGVPVLLIATLP